MKNPRILIGSNEDPLQKQDIHISNNLENKKRMILNTIFEERYLSDILERRNYGDLDVSIGLCDNEWFYCLNPIEKRLSTEDVIKLEDILLKLPKIININISNLLKDQKLAKELVKNSVIPHLNELDSIDRIRAAEIISRYSIGLGILEVFNQDPLIEDIIISAPSGTNNVCIVTKLSSTNNMSIFCKTNIIVPENQLAGILARARIFNGGELSVLKPILELDIPYLKARLSAVSPPISQYGFCVAIRKRSDFLWTLPRLISLNSIGWTAAGFLSLCCAARASIVIAGGRGSGKTTILSALLPELPQIGRILIMEDTEELPILELQRQGLSVQRFSLNMEKRSASRIMHSALRMGEGPIVIGEIRGEEASVLFESIRTGTANSTVLGTIHASDPGTVRNRILIDLGLDETSYQSIDLIVMAYQKGQFLSGGYKRYISEICQIDNSDTDARLKPLFRIDDSDNLISCMSEFDNLHSLGRKISTFIGIDTKSILKAAWIKGYIKRIQAIEWLRTKNDRILSVAVTRHLNKLSMPSVDSIDFLSLREIVTKRIHEVCT